MKTITAIVVQVMLYLHPLVLYSQDLTQTIKGSVIDSDTKMPLFGANVLIMNITPQKGTITGEDGRFRFTGIPVGRYDIRISYVGYEDRFISNVLVSSGKEVDLDASLTESVSSLQEVVVSAGKNRDKPVNSMSAVSARAFNVEETQRYAASFFDPARMAQSFAGVATADDENNEIVIRGNSAMGLLWRLEGIEIPNPNHFSNGEGGTGGGICMISNAVLANSDFMTGAFAAEYGNATSGVFDLKFRNGNTDRHEYSVQAGILGLQASAEGPFRKGGQASYLINYRYSSLTLLDRAGIKFGGENSLAPDFQDINFKFNLPTKKSGRFSLFGIGGQSKTGDDAIMDTARWEYWSDRMQERENHRTGIIGLSHFIILRDENTWIRSTFAASTEENGMNQDTLDFDAAFHPVNDQTFASSALRYSGLINHKFDSRNMLRAGIIFSKLYFDYHKFGLNWEERRFVKSIDDNGNTSVFQTYMQWQTKLPGKVTLNTGLHYMESFLNHSSSLEPRLSITWQPRTGQSISYGFGLHSRALPPSINLARRPLPLGGVEQPNRDLGLMKAVHHVIGYDRSLSENFRLKAEAYYQFLFDIPVAADSSYISAINENSGFTNDKFLARGKGKNYGIELTLERFFDKNFYFLVTSSLFHSEYLALDHIWRNTRFDGDYIFNALGGKEFKTGKNKENIWGLNFRVIWRGGYRTIPIDLEASRLQGETVMITSQAFEKRSPDYFRFDLGTSFRKNKPKYSWSLNLDLQNLTNRLNLYQEYYNVADQRLERYTYSGLIPNLNYRVDF